MASRVSCVDLFCGAGGLTYGFSKEGIDVRAGIDFDPACRYPYEENNASKFIEADISRIHPGEVDALFDLSGYKVLAGCAPCQPFSTYSHRYDTRQDNRWSLLRNFAQLVKVIEPDVVTMENVPAVAKHAVYSAFQRSLKRLGYSVWSAVVECSGYGVPQTRCRFVMLASLHGPIEMISPTHAQPKTVRQAIGRWKPIGAGESAAYDRLHASASLSNKNLQRIRASRPGGTWRDWPKRLVAECHRGQSGKTFPSVYGRMEWDKPAPTMTTQCFGYGNGRFGHPEQDRAISLREAAILQSFPRSYRFISPDQKVQFGPVGRLIGNAVPVDLGRAIGKSIIEHLVEVECV